MLKFALEANLSNLKSRSRNMFVNLIQDRYFFAIGPLHFLFVHVNGKFLF